MKTISYEEIGQSTTQTAFINVSKNMPCPICRYTSWCSVTDDGWTVFCRRYGDDSQKKTDRNGKDYWVHRLAKPIKISNSSPLKNSNATLAEPEILHNIYQSMLKKLDLSDAHLQNLNARGLTDEEIEQIGYRTLPKRNRSIIAAELVYEFTPETCLQVPGIIRLTRDGQEKITIYGPAGLLIPIRDNDGFIVAIKVRTDSTQEGQSRYGYLSSTNHNGPSPGAQVHVPLYDGPTSIVRVTEGELKADITTMLSKTLTISIPGVSNYKPVIPVLKRLGAKKVIIAFDADCREKTHVADALQNAVCELTKEGFQIELETWDKDYGKGIDDLLSSGHQPETVSGGCLWATLMDIVKSAGTGPLEEVLMRAAFYSLIEQIKTNPKEVIMSALDDSGIVKPLSYMKLHEPETLDANLLKLQYSDVGSKDIKTLKGLMDLCNESVSEVKAPSSLMKVIDIFPDAPINPQVMTPNLYKLTKDGIYFGEDPKRIRVAYAPIILTAIFKNIKDNAETFKLAWLRDKEWESCIIPRADAVDAKKITAWGCKGLPVTSENAKHLITYLANFEKKNYVLLKTRVTNQMGWMDDDLEHGFIWGKSYIQNDGTIIDDISISKSNIAGGNHICFHGADIGDEELSSAYTSIGSFEEWKKAANSVSCFPRVLFALYTAFVPPLLSILDIDNFVVDWGNKTSTGKSTSLGFAASVWGNPNKRTRKGSSAIRSWNSTRVWIERAASNLVGIPLIMDDTKEAPKPELVAETIYKIASGQGKGRGSLEGTATTRTWQTVLLTSGELKAVDYSQDGGTHGRTITIGGAPFSPESPDMAVFVREFMGALRSNYGHAGPRFVQYIISNKIMWDEWRQEHKQIEEELINKSSNNSVVYRQVSYLAAIDLAARLAHTALELPWEYKSPVVALWDEFSSQAKEANKAAVALKYVVDWAFSHPNTFFNREVHDYSDRTPTGGWSGRWDAGDDWDYIAFIPSKLEELLKKENYDCSTIKRSWKENDWLIVEKGRSDTRYTVAGARTRVIAIKKSTIDEVYYKD